MPSAVPAFGRPLQSWFYFNYQLIPHAKVWHACNFDDVVSEPSTAVASKFKEVRHHYDYLPEFQPYVRLQESPQVVHKALVSLSLLRSCSAVI